MHRHPWKRLLAWLVDWLLVLAWAGLTAAVGIPLFLSGVTAGLHAVALNVIAVVVLVLPVTVVLAAFESGGRQATPGKRTQRLVVTDAATGGSLRFLTALGRNALKIAVPWTLGHAAVFAIVSAGGAEPVPVWIWVITAAAYVLPIVYVVTLFVAAGRTPYDRITGARVVLTT